MNSNLAQSQWRMLDMLPAVSLFLIGLMVLVYAVLFPRGENGQFAVLMRPWADASQVSTLLKEADAQILSFNERMNVVVVHSDRLDAISALYNAGAWLVFEPAQLSSCFDLAVTGA
ncbi:MULTISPECIES: hypothetical protein [Brucella/Ochrobactrum group]|jgi:hypothetical protein|uniref:hypothetical protein n=1 Tax=Brucella/Ochrobactrum group TaxID=2826938 RepID=UPI001C04ADEF|nr:hypothetical protein [Brucella sp. NBRC 12950]QWK79371.1 hypothetical protein KMS41_18020 [Ochrobactrum sp. BTU1]GLU28430.1 hypothetical protein Brsp01_36630 [Brucella sp. NBRC 12950]